jgi:hypothetical protein
LDIKGYIGILLGAHPILHISRIRVNKQNANMDAMAKSTYFGG